MITRDWKKRLEELATAERESRHPLAALKEDRTPAYPQANAGEGGEAAPDLGGTEDTKAEENDAPTLTRPTESELAKEAAATREALGEAAGDRVAAGEAERAAANGKSKALYEALLRFTEKQDGRYDALLDMILADDYRSSTGARDIFYEYLTEGQRAAEDSLATAAGANGGNGDSYSAALAAGQRTGARTAGDAAAREYYGEQLDRILSVLQAAGGDMTDLFGVTQDNVDTAGEVATDDLSLGAELLKALSDAQEAGQKIEASVFSDLLTKADKTQTMSISPMQLDEEYKQMTSMQEGGGRMLPVDALIALWEKYPDMQSYILQKYELLLSPSYGFGK